MKIDFNSYSSEILLNPRIDLKRQADLIRLMEENQIKDQFGAHVFIASSGTTRTEKDDFKLVALSKKAILTSAHAVNCHLGVSSQDVWLNSLPVFHVGGLGIFARSYLTNSNVILLDKWEAKEFVQLISLHDVTLTSLVPSQVYDLVMQQLKAPKSLRAVIVGGGAINNDLYEKALLLGWPLLLSYGLTECASQVATSKLKSPNLHLLNHVEAKISDDGFLMIKSEALLTANILIDREEILISDPKCEGWLTTEDLATINGETITIHGRSFDFIKIGGEGVMFSHLEKRLEEIKLGLDFHDDAALVAFPDDRLGFVVHLASVSCKTGLLVEKFNSSVMPYERIRHIHFIDQIPRTALNKVCKAELLLHLQARF